MNKWLGTVGALVALAALWWWNREAPAPIDARTTPPPVLIERTSEPSPPSVEEMSASTPTAETPAKPIEPLPTQVENYPDWLREIVTSLASQPQDQNSLLTAAMILQTFEATQAPELRNVAQLLADAHALAPLDAVIASAAFRICGKRQNCDPAPYEKTLQTVDASNELSFIGPVLIAARSGSARELRQALNQIQFLRLRLYTGELAVRARRAIAAAATSALYSPPTMDLERMKDELTVRIVGAIPPPAYDLLIERCKTNDYMLKVACGDVGEKLARAEMLVLQSIALNIQRSARGPGRDGVNAFALEEAYLRWITGELADHPPPAARWLGLLQTSETEMLAAHRWLEVSGVNVPRTPRSLEWR